MVRSRNRQLLHHVRRSVASDQLTHVTSRLVHGLISLRTPAFKSRFEELLDGVRKRDVQVVGYAILSNHIHLALIPGYPGALGNAMRFLLSKVALWVNRRMSRRGAVFDDRYYSRVARAAKDVFHLMNYVLGNPVKAGLSMSYIWADRTLLTTHRQLRCVFGVPGAALEELLLAMCQYSASFVRLIDRLQLSLDLAPRPPCSDR